MISPEAMAGFFVTSLLLGAAPGPDNIFVLTQSALYGAGAGIATTLGLVSGLCVHTAAVALGVAALLQSSSAAFAVLKIIGALYLLRLAWLCFRSGAARTDVPETSRFPGYAALYRRGIIMNVTNPKVSLFFLAVLPQFCAVERGDVFLQTLCLGGLFICATVLVFFSVSALGGRLAVWFNRSPRGQMLMHRLAGSIFIALAATLFLSA
ncbi:MAG: LysE family translocator [Desulfovibrio sp.]|jgi:threonine/homoserine/homoserine lactone efflux protein|nr:LysE family translocator [Desulfovibrio sp.]